MTSAGIAGFPVRVGKSLLLMGASDNDSRTAVVPTATHAALIKHFVPGNDGTTNGLERQ